MSRLPIWRLALLMLWAAACTPVSTPPSAAASPAPSRVPPSATAAATRTASPVPPTPIPTATPTPRPLETFGLLARPVPPDANPFPSLGYLYGSTANQTREPHHGIDLANPQGTPVLAALDGSVLYAGSDANEARFSPWKNFYGNLVVLEHHHNGYTFYTLYAHLSEVDVQTGQHVQMGERIGAVGLTGVAVGAHLHFEVRMGGTAYTDTRNPVLWLQPADPTRRGALRGRIQHADGTAAHLTFTVQQIDDAGRLLMQYNLETYAPEKYPVPTDAENFALGDLPAGTYRLALVASGQTLERLITVTDDRVTALTITLP